MVTEQQKTAEALQVAIQMEIDGKEFYLKAYHATKNEMGKKLSARLAEEEEIHQKVFQEIYKSIQNKKGWPLIDFNPDNGQVLRTIFAEMSGVPGKQISAVDNELDIVNHARQMESNTYDFYTSRGKKATEAAEKEFYNLLAMQEQIHNLLLADYYEYLQNPAGWLVKQEHPHFD